MQLVESLKRLQQAILHRVLGVDPDQPSGDGIQPRQLLPRQRTEPLGLIGCVVHRLYIRERHGPHIL
jgi:hypothetical protein